MTVTGDVGEISELSLATMTLRAPLLVGLAALASIINAEAPAQLISGRGEFAAPTAAAVAGSLPAGSSVSVVASLGGSARGRRLLNAVFGTSFATELTLGAPDDDSAGAWLAASPSTGALVVETVPTDAAGESRSAADACKLASFSLALADAVIVHAPCVAPSPALVKAEFERLFSHHLAAGGAEGAVPTLLVHVGEPVASGGLSAVGVAKAAKEAWASASSSTELKGKQFDELFELETIELPSSSATDMGGEFEEGVAAIKSRLSGLSGQLKPGGFVEAAASAWQAAGSSLDEQPSEAWLEERFLAARAYESAYEHAQSTLRKWSPTVAKGGLVKGFGSDAAEVMQSSLAKFDAGVAASSAAAAPMLAQRRTRLQKALVNDITELFTKQHRQLSLTTITKFKAQLLKVQARAGNVAEWQQEGLRRNAEKHFDGIVGDLMVEGVGEATKAQLVTAFGKQLTEVRVHEHASTT